MNDELIKQLYEERKKIYPYGCPIQPRGNGKTFLYLSHFLRYTAYDLICGIYKHINREMTLEQAHKDIDDYVVAQMPDCYL